MLEKNEVDCLIVGQTPPPYHGQAVVTGMLFGHTWTKVKVSLLRMSYSDSIHSVGRFSLSKVGHLIYLILMTWKEALVRRPSILYYLPASANKTPVLRDLIYLAAVKWCFKKKVYHFHAGGLPEFLSKQPVLGRLAGLVYGEPDVAIDVIETSPPNGRYFNAWENVAVNNGVKVGNAVRQRPATACFRLLYVGVLNEGKGILDILSSLVLLKRRGTVCEAVLVGAWVSEIFEAEALGFIQENEIEEMVRFTGPLDGDAKWQMYADADCMFFPSHYEAETFGMVLVEAMAFGLPLVTTRWRGIPLVVGDSGCATLCEINSPEQYTDAIEQIIQDEKHCESMGKAAREHYEAEYTEEMFLSRMEDVFERLVRRTK